MCDLGNQKHGTLAIMLKCRYVIGIGDVEGCWWMFKRPSGTSTVGGGGTLSTTVNVGGGTGVGSCGVGSRNQ